ncbi:50S ribosomal protein L23 [Candidatus Roizmanbacteria bacterium]|nr:MAG: 50S ribosomal protein L23 [Candidatus Roizmanbacteria bacterium]
MKITNILSRPLVTEKSTQLAQNKVYQFEVNTQANKHQVAQTVEELFKVTVESVRIAIRKGKEKRVGKKMMTKKRADIKIAYVKLSEGSIDLFPQAA